MGSGFRKIVSGVDWYSRLKDTWGLARWAWRVVGATIAGGGIIAMFTGWWVQLHPAARALFLVAMVALGILLADLAVCAFLRYLSAQTNQSIAVQRELSSDSTNGRDERRKTRPNWEWLYSIGFPGAEQMLLLEERIGKGRRRSQVEGAIRRAARIPKIGRNVGACASWRNDVAELLRRHGKESLAGEFLDAVGREDFCDEGPFGLQRVSVAMSHTGLNESRVKRGIEVLRRYLKQLIKAESED